MRKIYRRTCANDGSHELQNHVHETRVEKNWHEIFLRRRAVNLTAHFFFAAKFSLRSGIGCVSIFDNQGYSRQRFEKGDFHDATRRKIF